MEETMPSPFTGYKSSLSSRLNRDVIRNRTSAGGGSSSLRWRARWVPPKEKTTRIRITRGAYTDFKGDVNEYHTHFEHFITRSRRSVICSKNYVMENDILVPTKDSKCLACDAYEAEEQGINHRQVYKFNMIHLDWYHEVPAFDKQGRPILFKHGKNKGKQATNQVPCEGRRCQYCREGLDKTFGRKAYWPVGRGHLQDLGGIVTEIERECINCADGMLEVAAYTCMKCYHALIEMDDTNKSNEQIDEIVAIPQECPNCGHVDYLEKQVECDKCEDGKPLSLFDCDLEIKRTGEGTNSTIQIPRWHICDLDPRVEKMVKPFAFDKMFKPDTFEEQAKALRIENPYKGDEQQHSEDYDNEANYEDN